MTQRDLGTIRGIFIPNITVMFGVILFLRLTIITSHVGIFEMMTIIGLSLMVMLITSLSIASIATNLEVGAGGIYYLITRTLGVEIGGAVGFAIYLAQLISISLGVTGFAFLLSTQFTFLPAPFVEIVVLILLTAFAGLSSSWVMNIQILIVAIVSASIIAVFLGSNEIASSGANFSASYDGGEIDFWHGFALFYPAMTGIEGGMALSARLRNPASAFLYGNIFSLVIAALVYAGIASFAYFSIPLEILREDSFALVKFALSSDLVAIGIYSATLAGALASLRGAPQMLKSIAADGIFPKILAKTMGRDDEPIVALGVTFVLALIVVGTTRLDQVLPILTMICLITYGLVNFIAAIAELMNTPSWRPTFKVHWSISLSGALLSFLLMLFISTSWTLAALLVVFGFFFAIQRRRLKVGFKDFRDSVIFFFSRIALYRLASPARNALTWHPQLLVLTKTPAQHLKIAHLSHTITQKNGILTLTSVLPADNWSTLSHVDSTRRTLELFFQKEQIECLVQMCPAQSLSEGYLSLIRSYGIGPIQPNTVLLNLDDEVLQPEFIMPIIKACRSTGKNLVLIGDSANIPVDEFRRSSEKKIDLWWDRNEAGSFSLALSLLSAIRNSSVWNDADVKLKCVAANEKAFNGLRSYLNVYVRENRLPMKSRVYVEANTAHYSTHINKYADSATITCVALAPLLSTANDEQYVEELQALRKNTSDAGVCLYISCYDEVDRREIYDFTRESE